MSNNEQQAAAAQTGWVKKPSDTPRIDEALAFTTLSDPRDVAAHPERWVVNVARDLERELAGTHANYGALWKAHAVILEERDRLRAENAKLTKEAATNVTFAAYCKLSDRVAKAEAQARTERERAEKLQHDLASERLHLKLALGPVRFIPWNAYHVEDTKGCPQVAHMGEDACEDRTKCTQACGDQHTRNTWALYPDVNGFMRWQPCRRSGTERRTPKSWEYYIDQRVPYRRGGGDRRKP